MKKKKRTIVLHYPPMNTITTPLMHLCIFSVSTTLNARLMKVDLRKVQVANFFFQKQATKVHMHIF